MLSCVLVFNLIHFAFAGPPFDTDDPEPVDFHHWEFYVSSMYSHDGNSVTGTMPHCEINYGAVPNLQIHLLMPVSFSEQLGQPSNYGYGDTEFGIKYRFLNETKNHPQIGVFPLVEYNTGSASRGLGNGKTQFFFPVWMQKSWGNWTSYGGGGYWINPGAGNKNYWFLGIELQDQVTSKLALGGEVYYISPKLEGASQEKGFHLGFIYDFNGGHHLLFSLGKDFQGQNALSGYLGYQWIWANRPVKKR